MSSRSKLRHLTASYTYPLLLHTGGPHLSSFLSRTSKSHRPSPVTMAFWRVFFLEAGAEGAGFFHKGAVPRHRRRTAARAKDSPLIVKVTVFDESLVVQGQGFKGPGIAILGDSQEGRFHMLGMEAAVEGTEAVDDDLQLGRHAEIVQGRSKDNHIRAEDGRLDAVHGVVQNTRSFVAAGDAACARLDVGVSYVDNLYVVTFRLGAFRKGFGQ